ncbi:unnamed protein product [Ranitomeya imitator]|uniref:Gypsy retrotransposon integrase-like protein 1 n=1 Tax=Ranitomeya imitator TaxID=111125 RepID=A0ABN9M9Q6_9NEOB|nr:unnamed protein product [Ranitomeya imitator]
MVVDDEEKANILNTFFSTVFTVEKEMLGEIPRNNENPILRVTNLTQEEVRNRLNKIKIDKSPGPDGIHPRVLRELTCYYLLLEALRSKGVHRRAVSSARLFFPLDIRVLQDTAVDMDIQALCSSMDNLVALGLLYDEPNSVDQAEKNLLALCQGQDDVEVYCQKFRKWSVLTLWNESALAALFRKGLSEALKDVMVGFPMPAGLNESMSLAIQIGRRLRERKSVHHLAVLSESKPEPMQCNRTMTKVERHEHRRLNRLCFYCGDSTHAISNCPKRTRRFDSSAVIGTVQSKFLLSITLMCSLSSYSVMAFVDSGAALNLMDLDYAKRCGFFLEPLRCPIPLRGIDATPLAKNKPQYWAQLTMCMAPAHQEVIRFLVLHNLHDVVVLGLPWLQTHNPVLDWNSMSVTSWGCQGVHGDVPFLSISSSIPSDIPEFLSDFQDVFEESKSDALPPHRNCDCAIDLIPGSKFPKGRLFNLSVPEHTAMRSYVKESLEKGHIRPSSSPLGAGFFFVAKKDGSLRPCIDYRLLNKITVKFQYPLPLISDLFARIKGASWFTKIDLRGAYNLVRIRQGDEWKTAFNTPEGHFEYLVMPFGLANAPSVFQSFMHDIFREYLDKFLIVYLDDILIFSDDWESHVKQVRMVFQVLRANSLFVKGSKCLFGVQKVSFLGFIFSPSTIEMDPVKVQAIQDWTQPTSLKSLQKFLGFANFYRRFICNFSSIARPLTDLTKKGADLVNWSSAAVEAFQELKRRFCCAPVLCQPDVSLPFQVEVDASEIGAGAVLSQRGSGCSVFKPCAFFSRKFSAAERNYDVGNRELLAMKWAFEEWRHWLEGAKHRVVVLTDHKNLTYLESAKRLNPRQARWSLFFARFDFVISYLPGSKNVKADALSRSFVPDSPGLSEPASILKEGVIVSAISPDLRRVLQKFQANKPDRCPAEKLFVPDRWTSKVISELHCSVLAGHPGIFGTRELVARSFWWPSLSRDHVVRLHGIPENIVSDRGSQFVSRFWRAFCGRMGIDLSFSSAFHPQTNGQTERTNQTLETYLRCFVSADQHDWVSFLPLAEFALNNRASSATLVSPFFCNSGFHPRFSSGQVESSDCPGVDYVVDRLQQIWTQVVDNLTLSQEKAQLFANRRRRVGPRLRVGDLVWLSSRHIPMKVSSPKFKPRFIGPYRISEILNPVSFRLTLPDSFSIHNVFHRSLLRRYVAPMVPSVEPPAPVLVEGELEYIVEKILDSRVSRRKLQYLVKWKGYAQEDNSWVFASDVHAPDLVRAFHVAHPGRPGGSACYYLLLEALRSKGVHRRAVSSARINQSLYKSFFCPPHTSHAVETFVTFVQNSFHTLRHDSERGALFYPSNLSLEEKHALTALQDNNSIIIKPANKGGALVVMDKSLYLSEIKRQLSDRSVYCPLNKDPSYNIRHEIDVILHKYSSLGVLDKKTCNFLTNNNPITTTQSLLLDTNAFLDTIHQIGSIPVDALLVTLYVKDLYTSIPHLEGIASTQRLLSVTDLDTDQVQMCIDLLTLVRGTAMGSKVAPPMLMPIWLTSKQVPYITMIYFATMGPLESLLHFLDFLNSSWPGMAFTMGYDQWRVNFLDSMVIKDPVGILSTDLYIKQTDRNSILHFQSLHHLYKKKIYPQVAIP